MPGLRATPVVRVLLIVNVLAFLSQLFCDTFLGTHVLEIFALVPHKVFQNGYYWQLFTYMFMHGDLFHILFNMLILWMIGSELEGKWGGSFFTRYYMLCGVSAGLFYMTVQAFFKGTPAQFMPMAGSSGAVYGLLVAYGIIFSERTLLFMMVFPMKAKHFVMVLGAIEFIATVFYSRSGVANAAHLGGMIVGFIYLFLSAYLRMRSRDRASGPKKKSRFRKGHLRLVVNNEVIREFEDDNEERDDGEPGKPTFH